MKAFTRHLVTCLSLAFVLAWFYVLFKYSIATTIDGHTMHQIHDRAAAKFVLLSIPLQIFCIVWTIYRWTKAYPNAANRLNAYAHASTGNRIKLQVSAVIAGITIAILAQCAKSLF
jgi:hypothetical protein